MSTTARFAWVDRDTAARDLIQLAYYGPPYVSRLAIELLQAIRSPAIVPELEAIVLDRDRELWERRYALRAIAATPGEIYMPQFAELVSANLEARVNYEREIGDAYSDLVFHNDLLTELRDFVDLHPGNQQWFFNALAGYDESPVLARFLASSLTYERPNDIERSFQPYLLSLLEKHPDWFDWDTAAYLYVSGDQSARQWLNGRLDQVVQMCLQKGVEKRRIYFLLEKWLELRDAVIQERPEVGEVLTRGNQKLKDHQTANLRAPRPDFHLSPGYQKLEGLYQRALDGDSKAFQELCAVRAWPPANIPKQAVATYFLGKLRHQYDVLDLLCQRAAHGPDTHREDTELNFPIRFEAGEALRDTVSPRAWEALVDAFFIRPANVLEEFLIDWIAHLTDLLSGITTVYEGMILGDSIGRWWFHALDDEA